MDQPPQPIIPFGLFYGILNCFDRRELCQLRYVNHRHYTVIENKFGTTRPYLMFNGQYLNRNRWKWRPASGQSYEEMPSDVRVQLPLSKFVRFKWSEFLDYNPSENNIDLLSMGHVWKNQGLAIGCGPNYIWNEEWIHMATKAEGLQMEAKGLFSYLRQLTSGDCMRLSLIDWTDTLDAVELPWDHILDFLFQPNPKATKIIHILARSPFDHHQRETLDFIQQMKQKFLESLVPLDLDFGWETVEVDELIAVDDFVVHNRRTKQSLRLRSTDDEFRLTVEKQDP